CELCPLLAGIFFNWCINRGCHLGLTVVNMRPMTTKQPARGALMDRTTRLTPNDAGYVVAHANEDGAYVDTAITLTERLDLALEDRGHEMVLPERAREDHR